MYHTIVRAKTRRIWARMARGDYRAAVDMAAPTVRFRFVGDAAPAAELVGRDAFEQWFADLYTLLPGLRLRLTDVVAKGWPWKTTVVVRLAVSATLADGSRYENEGIQWVTLRWGRMVDDYVLEDTARLAAAIERQHRAVAQGAGSR
ncbi:nuclear transport factor 2 family protein [Embleya sp. MST-111070]|uniref:nuclear transport factor 2 family protein n=1 Tax=Embleya sp. MST-111070 TaxID=3398231 RepID=UPI003F73F8EF